MRTLVFLAALLAGVTALAQQPAPPASTGNAESGKKLFLRDGCWSVTVTPVRAAVTARASPKRR
jgi:hypothetical protein